MDEKIKKFIINKFILDFSLILYIFKNNNKEPCNYEV